MERLSYKDLESLQRHLLEIYGCLDLDSFTDRLFSSLAAMIPSDFRTYNRYDLREQTNTWLSEPVVASFPEEEGLFERHANEHPFFRHYLWTRDGSARRLSDLIGQRQWHNLELYNDVYRELGVEHKLAIPLPAPAPLAVAVVLIRSGNKDFSERDRLLLDVLRPHLAQAYQNAETVTRMREGSNLATWALAESDRGAVAVTGKGRVRWCTEQARRLISQYFKPYRGADHLPESLWRWVEHEKARLQENNGGSPSRKPLVMERLGQCLTVRLVDYRSEDKHLLLLEERHALSAVELETLGLTRREAEILLLVARGKTNKEVATALYISPLTTRKHLENIYHKLGVRNRVEATFRALEAMGRTG